MPAGTDTDYIVILVPEVVGNLWTAGNDGSQLCITKCYHSVTSPSPTNADIIRSNYLQIDEVVLMAKTTTFWTSGYQYSNISWLFDPKWLIWSLPVFVMGWDLQWPPMKAPWCAPKNVILQRMVCRHSCLHWTVHFIAGVRCSLLKMCFNYFQWRFKLNPNRALTFGLNVISFLTSTYHITRPEWVGVIWGKPASPPPTSRNPSFFRHADRSGQKYHEISAFLRVLTFLANLSWTPQVPSSIAMGATHDVSEDEGGCHCLFGQWPYSVAGIPTCVRIGNSWSHIFTIIIVI